MGQHDPNSRALDYEDEAEMRGKQDMTAVSDELLMQIALAVWRFEPNVRGLSFESHPFHSKSMAQARAVAEVVGTAIASLTQRVESAEQRAKFAEDAMGYEVKRCNAAEAKLAEVERERDEARLLARALSNALITVRPLGGSELFSRVGDEFYADTEFCTDIIQKDREALHEARKEVVTTKRAREAAEARVAAQCVLLTDAYVLLGQVEKYAVLETSYCHGPTVATWCEKYQCALTPAAEEGQ